MTMYSDESDLTEMPAGGDIIVGVLVPEAKPGAGWERLLAVQELVRGLNAQTWKIMEETTIPPTQTMWEYTERDRPEFVEHQCWRMLFVWPSDDGTEPGHAVCQGCEARYRFVREDR